ncbi:hypothetical protein IB262_23145 [Ensifer sp. ENS02]|uniref:hypothetical protein n=1 Tax=Ensifer sp. ENS02 TaxID=2769290 RepID=UPI001782D7C6|nr:hypothetical protein [Ensifer sp. ENS02]MBD9522796.1 hypothetical protein [Ensifer sp. ENS02]
MSLGSLKEFTGAIKKWEYSKWTAAASVAARGDIQHHLDLPMINAFPDVGRSLRNVPPFALKSTRSTCDLPNLSTQQITIFKHQLL